MTRSLLCVAAALAFAVSLPAYHGPAVAQESAGAEATADSSQSADASADTSGSADAQSSGTQSDSQASSSTDASSDQSATADSGSAETSSSQSASNDTSADTQSTQSDNQSQSGSPSLPPPSQTDASADADANADANVDANASQNQDRAQSDQSQQTDANRDPSARGRVDARTDARGRAGADARGRDGRNNEIRRGIRFGRANNRGLTINFIQQNSVFAHSGLRRGDVIISLRGRPVRSEADFIRWMAFHPGDRVPVIVLRDGREETVYIEYDQEVIHADQPYDQASSAYLGVNFDAQVRNAAVVRNITPGSPAEQAGLQPGDMIVALNGQEVRSHQEAIGVIRSMQPGDRLSIAFERRMQNETEAVLAGRPGEPVRTATFDSDVRVERRALPPEDNRRVDVEIDANDRPIQDRDRDANRDNDRPLLRRILD